MPAAVIDCCHLGTPKSIGCWLIDGEQPVIVDPGPEITLNTMLEGLGGHGLGLTDLAGVLLTHIHLDHAGAAGRLVELHPDLPIYVHEIGAQHLVEPSKLLASAGRLYGGRLDEVWGKFLAVPAGNIRRLSGGEQLKFGERSLRVEYTPGHASHHVCFLDESEGAAYEGDVAGIRIPPSQYTVPPTPPPDVDIEEWSSSIALVEAWQPTALRLTHFGEVGEIGVHLNSLREALSSWSDRVRITLDSDDLEAIEDFKIWVRERLRHEMDVELAATYEQVAPPDQLWLGLARYWRKRL